MSKKLFLSRMLLIMLFLFIVLISTGCNGQFSYILTVAEPFGEGSVSPAPGRYSYPGEETTITQFSAEPAGNYYFSHWEGDVPDSFKTKKSFELLMDRHRNLKPVFIKPLAEEKGKDEYAFSTNNLDDINIIYHSNGFRRGEKAVYELIVKFEDPNKKIDFRLYFPQEASQVASYEWEGFKSSESRGNGIDVLYKFNTGETELYLGKEHSGVIKLDYFYHYKSGQQEILAVVADFQGELTQFDPDTNEFIPANTLKNYTGRFSVFKHR